MCSPRWSATARGSASYGVTTTDPGTVVLANYDLIDKLGVAVLPSISVRAPIVRFLDRFFRFLPQPCGASARDPSAPPSTRRSPTLRQATEADTGGSVL